MRRSVQCKDQRYVLENFLNIIYRYLFLALQNLIIKRRYHPQVVAFTFAMHGSSRDN